MANSVPARHLTGLDQLVEHHRQATSEQQRAEVEEFGQPVRVGGKQQLAERNQLQRFANQCMAERAGIVHGQADVDEDVAEYQARYAAWRWNG